MPILWSCPARKTRQRPDGLALKKDQLIVQDLPVGRGQAHDVVLAGAVRRGLREREAERLRGWGLVPDRNDRRRLPTTMGLLRRRHRQSPW